MHTAVGCIWPPDDDGAHDNDGARCLLQSTTAHPDAVRFAAEMLRMYTGFAKRHGWSLVLDELTHGVAGLSLAAVLHVDNPGAYGWLKYEHGTHRVQRVPVDVIDGRIRTNTVKVVVQPLSSSIELIAPGSAEKIRTYNFPQNRVTDHRINLYTMRLQEVLAGDLDGIIFALRDAQG